MRRLAREKIRHWVRVLLHTQDSPRRTSLAFAVGIFIAFLPPVPWFHTLAALIVAFVFRLNRLATLIGTYLNTPFTMLPLVAAELSVGLSLVGGQDPPELTWRQLENLEGWKEAFFELKPFVPPLMVGSILLGLVASVVVYFVSFKLILVYRRRVAHADQLKQMELELPPPSLDARLATQRDPVAQAAAATRVATGPQGATDPPENPS